MDYRAYIGVVKGGMENNMEPTIMGYIGTTLRIHFLPS